MKELALHFAKMRRRYPRDILMIVFDIDGTILDLRYLIHHVLREFDRIHGTSFFDELNVSDIKVHENHVDDLLQVLRIPLDQRRRILDFWSKKRWLTSSLMESHRPFAGVMEIIRWFQIQPNVVVGLNTGRPESLRTDTLRSLNAIGREYKVCFEDEHLHMNAGGWEEDIPQAKVAAILRFQEAGYRVIAMADNEPANLAAVAEMDGCREILPLHAQTIFESGRGELPSCSVSGSEYVLSDLASEDALPNDIQFVWHGVNDLANLQRFLASDIQWCEIDVRADPQTGELILHHDSLNGDSDPGPGPLLALEEVVRRVHGFGKSIKFDLKERTGTVDCILEILVGEHIEESRLWFNGNVEVLGERGFKELRNAFPAAIIQCPIGFLIPEILDGPADVHHTLAELQSWGVSRFSIEWDAANTAGVIDQMGRWGFEINVYNVPDLDSFLQAVLLEPDSITADFNFPKWHYYGRGSGENGRYYEYSVRDAFPAA